MRESDLLEHIYRRSGDLPARDPSVVAGPGDDCAVVRTTSGDLLLLTVDQAVEGRHFAPGTPVDLVARKAVARSVSDIAAMAGRPRWGLGTGLLPETYAEADALFDAMARWARHWGCPLVGGDIATWGRSNDGRLALTVAVVGEAHAARGAVRRSGARPGDGVYVTGAIGGSLASGRHLRFEPRLREAWALAAALGDALHAMIDLSDGLGIDAARLAAASGARVRLEAGRIPLHTGAGPWQRAIADGEDYELLFAAADGARVPAEAAGTAVTRIGTVVEGSGCVVVDQSGAETDASRAGWDHGSSP